MKLGAKRSHFLAAGIAALAPLDLFQSPASAQSFDYKFAHQDPVDLPTNVRIVQMCDAIKAETNDRLRISVFPNSILGSQTSLIAQLRLGSIQFFSSNHSAFASIVPVTQISAVGFAFNSSKQPLVALDGALGDYIRKEFAAKGLHVFEKSLETGFRQVTSSSKPLKNAEDFGGFKIRVLPAAIYVDLFKSLGASPVPIDSNELYTSLQTHIVEGQDNNFVSIESFRLYEVQKYISLTSHAWGGAWWAANAEAWNTLPADIQSVVSRNAAKYALLERRDFSNLNGSLADKLGRQGVTLNAFNPAGIRPRLGTYYSRWKNEFGTTAWGLLEASVGKLG